MIQVSATVDASSAALSGVHFRQAEQAIRGKVKRSLRIGFADADEKREAYLMIRDGSSAPVDPSRSGPGSGAASPQKAVDGATEGSSSSSSTLASTSDSLPAAASFRGRLFRSPTLWEDAVKTVTCTNIAWAGTRRMNRALCGLRADGAFPSPTDILSRTEEELRTRAGVGYRARRLIQLAALFEGGQAEEGPLEPPAATAAQALNAVLKWPGIGPYAGRALCQLLGHFDYVPVDTETLRHLREYHGLGGLTLKTAAAAADRIYEPYRASGTRFLAFWGELWGEYERRLGVVREMDSSEYDKFTARSMQAALGGAEVGVRKGRAGAGGGRRGAGRSTATAAAGGGRGTSVATATSGAGSEKGRGVDGARAGSPRRRMAVSPRAVGAQGTTTCKRTRGTPARSAATAGRKRRREETAGKEEAGAGGGLAVDKRKRPRRHEAGGGGRVLAASRGD